MTCFQNLRNTLEDIFSATVQGEEDFSYASATLILSSLLQIHARTPRYASYRARLESFPDSVSPIADSNESSSACGVFSRPHSPHPSANELASAGFFHTGSGDETVCPACGLGLRDWQPTDQPETCHLAYSTAEIGLRSSGDDDGRLPVPALPCLYLAAHRLLTSELPLARKSLVPAGSFQSVCSLPGVVTPPVLPSISGDIRVNYSVEFVSLSDRLHAIACIMASPPSPQGWPVENARTLGHSDDLIVLALWRLQAETTRMGLACPTTDALRLDPQSTAELLRAILHLQEGFDSTMDEFLMLDSSNWDGHSDDSPSQSSDNTELTAEDAETAALSQCANQRVRRFACTNNSLVNRSDEMPFKRVRLPPLSRFIRWWSSRWSTHHHCAQK